MVTMSRSSRCLTVPSAAILSGASVRIILEWQHRANSYRAVPVTYRAGLATRITEHIRKAPPRTRPNRVGLEQKQHQRWVPHSGDLTSPAGRANLPADVASSSREHVTRVCLREMRAHSPEGFSVESSLLQLRDTRGDQEAEQRDGILSVVDDACQANDMVWWLQIQVVMAWNPLDLGPRGCDSLPDLARSENRFPGRW